MNDEWISSNRLVNLFGVSKMAISKAIASGKYTIREVQGGRGGRGGVRYEVLLSSLPIEIQKRYLHSQDNDMIEQANTHLPEFAEARQLRLSPKQVDDPDTWKKLHCWRVLQETSVFSRDGDNRQAKTLALAEKYQVSPITIYRWKLEVDGWHLPPQAPKALVGNESIPLPKTRKFSEEAVRYGLQQYGQNLRRGAKWAYEKTRAKADKEGWAMGDYSNFTRLLQKVPEAVWDACRQGMVAVERDRVPKVQRSWLAVPAFAVLCGDQNVDDCLALDPVTGEILVMNDYLWMDCHSRAWVGMWPSFGPYNKYTVAYSLRMAFQWAFPDQIYTDWGGPETSHNTVELVQGLARFCQVGSFEEMRERFSDVEEELTPPAPLNRGELTPQAPLNRGEPTPRAPLNRGEPTPPAPLNRREKIEGVEHRRARAGIPWHKPIENQMNLYRRYRLDREIPGFRQRSNEPWENKAIATEVKRQQRDGEIWTIERHLQERLAILQHHNAKTMKIKEGGGLAIVPGDKLKASLEGQPQRTRADDRTLDLLFLPRRELTPRQSSIAIKFPDGMRVYAAMELSRIKKGERVTVHADPFDSDRPAIISQQGEFLCLAERKKDINPVTREGLSDAIAEQRRMLKWWRQEVEKLVGLAVGDRGLKRIGKATQLAKQAEQEARDRIASKGDRERANDKVIELAKRRAS